MSAPRPPAALALATVVSVVALLAVACAERDDATPAPTPDAQATISAVLATPTPPPPLTDLDVTALLRRAVCWFSDPGLAAACIPPTSDAVEAIEEMERSGDPRFIAPLIDMRSLDAGWERWVEDALAALTGRRLDDPLLWYEWAATQEPMLPRDYATWKARLLSLIDPAFADFLDDAIEYAVRPDLLVWGGVGVDEVAPLDGPALVHRVEERYLAGSDVVFALELRGQARAYPRRIVAWHQVARDEIDGVPIALVFCGPCGGAIAYDPRANGVTHVLGSSGLVYDARPLLFDAETNSLWDPFTGRPVSGPLLGAGIELDRYTLITTTWEEWSARHPNTLVLSLDTGYVRDYGAGAALRAEFDSPDPTFPTGALDGRLPAKEQVLGIERGGAGRAYRVEEVRRRGIVHDRVGGVPVVLISAAPGGAINVYRADGLTVASLVGTGESRIAVDEDGERWFVTERALISTVDGREHATVPWREAYWFAWSSAYPETTIWGQ